MASISTDTNGNRRLQFTDQNGKRQTVRLGKIPKRAAETIKIRVEHLLTAKLGNQPVDGETARWVAGLDDVMNDRLARVGLIRMRQSALLTQFIEDYIAGRTDLKPRTVIKFKATKDYLVDYFGENRSLREITEGDADQFRLMLKGKGLAENTIRKHLSITKQFFTAAVRSKIVDENPFRDLKSTTQANPDRFYFISREEAQKVLEACPDNDWRLIFALSRFGGLRCPSEHLGLRWEDIDWERNRIRVRSPKTEHHNGKSSRQLPIFPELRPYLETAFDEAAEGAVHVIQRYRDTNSNLRTQFGRIIERAGLDQWPKLFQNLRSTRETELAEEFPLHVVIEWIGNSQAVATKHYLQVT
ncbi:MAG: tyrosine-type recombinase/integrase, partial [Planctomicrobium sp.]|nr:tyrosine-type recombinase/integrase [Planctomicrobium sp.]